MSRFKRFFLLIIFVICLTPFAYGITIEEGVVFKGNSSGGNVFFDQAVTCTQIEFTQNTVYFTALDMGGSNTFNIGFSSDTAIATMNVTDITLDDVSYTVNRTAGDADERVYYPSGLEPYIVVNAKSWWYADTGMIDITTEHTSPVDVVIRFDQSASKGFVLSGGFFLILLALPFLFLLLGGRRR
jgi:hypothetical protein